MLQAIKKENTTSDAARKKAFQNLKIVGNALYGTEDQIFALAESLGIDDAESLLGKQQIDGTYQLNVTDDVQSILDDLHIIEESIPNQLKSYADTLNDATSLITNGTTDFSKMQKFADQYAVALGKQEGEVNWQDLFVFDETTNSYVLSIDAYNNYIENQRQVLENAGATDDEITNILNNANKQFASAVDIGGYLKSDRREKARGDLKNQLINYYVQKSGATTKEEARKALSIAEQNAENIINALNQGGAEAVEAYRNFILESEGRDLTAEEVKNAYLAELTQYQNAFDELNEGIQKGSIVTNDVLKTALQKAHFEIDENGVVTSVGNMVEAYHNLYEGMKATNEATTSELNQAYLQLIEANTNKDKVGLEMLSSASNLDISLLENFASTMGYHLEAMLDESGNVINGWANSIQRTGVNSYEVTDWNRYLQQVEAATGHKIDQTSKEYIDSYIAWLDSQEIKTPEGKAALMTSLTANMNKLTREQIGQIALAFGKTYAEVESYLVKNADGTFDGRALLNSPEFDFDKSTPEYTSALKTLNDSLIEVNRQAEKNILEEAKSVADAQGGDWINLTQLSDALSKIHLVDENGSELDTTKLDELSDILSNYGAFLEDGILKLEPNANIPAIMQEIAQAASESGGLLANEMAELADAVADAIKSYADLIKNGISGSLSNVQAEQLQDWADSVGIGELTFTETADGLKIATDQAFELVAALQQVDSMQGKLVFNDLVDALSADKGGQFENISKTTAEIAKAQRQIAENEEEIRAIRKNSEGDTEADKRKITNLINQNKQLKEQIGLYREIQQRQSIDPSQYNFMDRELPDIMQGPINYWNSVGEAFASMNESAKTGRMDVQDFYNIVNEMSNLIAISGQPLEIAGIKLDGSAEQAAALIQKGMGALTNIDGKGVKINLEKLGIDFASGADGAKQNFADGVNALAKSQVAMLDAAIKVLEVVVAMEQLKDLNVDGGDNTLDLTDLFTIDIETGEVTGWDKDFQKASANILKLAEDDDDLRQALEQVKIGNTSLGEMLTAAKEGYKINGRNIEELGMSVDDYQTVMSSFYQAMLNGDYNLDSIQDSVWDILNKTLPEGTVIELGDRTVVVSGGSAVQIDWDSEGTKAGEQLLKDKLTDEVKTTKDALKQAFVKYQRGEADSVEVTAVLSAKGLIEIDAEKGTVTIDGKSIDLNTPAAQQYIAEKALEDQGIENITSQAGVKGDKNHYEYYATATGTVNIGTKVITASYIDGNITYHSDTTGQDYSSPEALREGEYEYALDQFYKGYRDNPGTKKEFENVEYGIPITPTVEVNGELDVTSIRQTAFDLLKMGNDEFVAALDKPEKIEDGVATYNVNGLEVQIEGKITPDKIEQAKADLKKKLGTDIISEGIQQAFTAEGNPIGEALSTAIVQAFTNLGTQDLGEQEIPEVKASISQLNITGVDNTNFGSGGFFGGLKNIFGASDLIIPSASAKINTLNITGVDIVQAESIAQQIVQAIQAALDNKPVKVSATSTPTTPTPETSETTQGVTAVINKLDDTLIKNSDQTIEVNGTIKSEQINTELNQLANENITPIAVPVTADDQLSEDLTTIKADAGTPVDMPINADANGSAKNKLIQLHHDAEKEAKKQVKINPIFPDSWKKIGDEITKTVKIQVTGDKIPESGGSVAGNVALSKGTTGTALAGGRTLMGELGPELVVSHGRYFVVGQNGPEMVNLDPDAIVFNHLQTRQLLANGKTGTHATPVTNERKATSLATGNASGPAMASASAALAALKQLRAMWQSLADASLKDLGGMPGGGAGGGGGGGGNDPATVKSVTQQVERWYNWIKEIESLQENINKLTKEYNLLEKQGLSTENKLANLRAQYEKRQQSLVTRTQYANRQREYRESEITRANNSLMRAFYRADSETGRVYLANDDETNAYFANFLKTKEGQKANGKLTSLMRSSGKIAAGTTLNYQDVYSQSDADAEAEKEYQQWLTTKKGQKASDKAKERQKKKIQDKYNKKIGSKIDKTLTTQFDIRTGADFMNELQRKNEVGENVHNAREQWELIQAMGFDDLLPKIKAGIDTSEEGWEEQAVENFYNAIDADKEAIESLTESIEEQEQAALEDAEALQEINEQIRELAQPLTGVTDSLEEWYNELKRVEAIQTEINRLQQINSNYQQDQIANGHEIYNNYKLQVEQLQQQAKLNQDLINKREKERADTVKKYEGLPISYDAKTGKATFNDTVRKLNMNTSYTDVKTTTVNGKKYLVDTDGNYVDDTGILRNSAGQELKNKRFGEQATTTITQKVNLTGTFSDIIKQITSQDATGKVAYNATQQYQILKQLVPEKYLQYDENGKKLYDEFGEITKEEQEAIVKAAISRIQKAADDINDQTSEINSLTEENLNIQGSILDIQNTLRDNSIEVQNLMKDAVQQEHQDAIDQKKELKDAIKDAADKTISGLRDNLEKDKTLYEGDKNKEELGNLQMQLSILRNTNGSISKIRDLQQKIQDKQKDIYFDERELAIDELEDTAQKQVEALEQQTELMQTALDYQVKYGLIWDEVNRKLSVGSDDSIADYILKNTPEFLAANREDQVKQLVEAIEKISMFEDYRRDGGIQSSLASLKHYAQGGIIDYTGPAWVDGTKTKPEYVFSSSQMDTLRQGLLNNVNLTGTLVSSMLSTLNNLPDANTYSSINNNNDDSIIIEHAVVNVNVQEVSSDYDSRKIGEQALNEMVRIARKVGSRNVSRR